MQRQDDAWQLATMLISEHSGKAPFVAAMIADSYLSRGDVGQAELYTSVASACAEMLSCR